MNKTPLNKGMLARSAALAAIMAFAAPIAPAQQPTPPGAAGQQQPNPMQQEFMQVRAELQQLQEQLGEIQEQVLQNNPELQQRQEDFRDLVMTTMEDQGANPQGDINKLKTLQAELQKEEIPEEKRQKLIQDFRQTNMELQQAQQEALQDEKVQEEQKSLNDDMMTAMVDADPQTETLLKKVEQARQKLMQIQQRFQQQQNGGPAPAR